MDYSDEKKVAVGADPATEGIESALLSPASAFDLGAWNNARRWAFATAWQAERYFAACDELEKLTPSGNPKRLGRSPYWVQLDIIHIEIQFLMNAVVQLDTWLSEAGLSHPLPQLDRKYHRIIRNCLEHWNEARRGVGPSINASSKTLPGGTFSMRTWLGRRVSLFGVVDVHELIDAALRLEAQLHEMNPT